MLAVAMILRRRYYQKLITEMIPVLTEDTVMILVLPWKPLIDFCQLPWLPVAYYSYGSRSLWRCCDDLGVADPHPMQQGGVPVNLVHQRSLLKKKHMVI